MRPTRKHLLFALLAVALGLIGWWARGVLGERWSAIPTRGGDPYTLPPMDTPHFLQRDPRWADETVGGSGERLARIGCTLCSLAMALDHYGIKTTPKTLNEFLKTQDGYNIRGQLKWNAVSNLSAGRVVMDYIGPGYATRIDAALKESRPVIAKIYIDGVIPHWVLIVGKKDLEYLMRDPLDDGKTLRPLSFYGSKLYAIRILKPDGSR